MGVQIGTEQIGTRVGVVVGLKRGTGGDVGAAEFRLLAGLAVAFVRHELRADRPFVILQILVEQRPGARDRVRHHIFADHTIGIGESFRMLVGGRIEHDARILCGPRRQYHDAGFLHLTLFFLVVVFNAGDAGALRVGQHTGDRAERSHLGAGLSGVGKMGDHRIGQRAGRAADGAPAIIDAGRPALELA